MSKTIFTIWNNLIMPFKLSFHRKLIFTMLLAASLPAVVHGQLTIDAEYRARLEVRDGYQKLAEAGATPAVFVSQRTRLYFTYEMEGLRFRFTPQDVRVWGDEQLASSTGVFGDESSLDLFEAFVEICSGKTTWFSVGRQQLVYDNERILAARNWNQSGISYDAVVFKWTPDDWNVHLGGSWNSTGENSSDNLYDPGRIKSLNFLWIQHSLAQGWDLSLSHVASGVTETDTTNTLHFRQTTGLYTTYKKGPWNLMGNIYYQYGKNNEGTDVSALLFDAEIYFKPGKPGIAAGISYLSGNNKTGDDMETDNLFDILYGARHKFFGSIDYFRSFDTHTRQGGLVNYYVFLDYNFSKKTSLKNTCHYFQLAETNPETPDDKKLGFENDLLIKHKFRSWGAIEAGHSFFLPTSSLKTIQGVEDAKFSQFIYFQLTITPSLFKQTKPL